MTAEVWSLLATSLGLDYTETREVACRHHSEF